MSSRNIPKVTILILIDGFLQYKIEQITEEHFRVTILILIDGFLQSINHFILFVFIISHNPYFNRWFSAIEIRDDIQHDQEQSQSLF